MWRDKLACNQRHLVFELVPLVTISTGHDLVKINIELGCALQNKQRVKSDIDH